MYGQLPIYLTNPDVAYLPTIMLYASLPIYQENPVYHKNLDNLYEPGIMDGQLPIYLNNPNVPLFS